MWRTRAILRLLVLVPFLQPLAVVTLPVYLALPSVVGPLLPALGSKPRKENFVETLLQLAWLPSTGAGLSVLTCCAPSSALQKSSTHGLRLKRRNCAA